MASVRKEIGRALIARGRRNRRITTRHRPSRRWSARFGDPGPRVFRFWAFV